MPVHDPEERFAAYQKQMALYRQLKPYFVRGTFHGLDEHIHLHTLADRTGGVLVIFNLTDTEQTIETHIPHEILHSGRALRVEGGVGASESERLKVHAEVPAMSPAIVCIGDAVEALNSRMAEPNVPADTGKPRG